MNTWDDPVAEELREEEEDAWDEYLAATRGEYGRRYEEVETWAWGRLTSRLYVIFKRRDALSA